MSRTIDSSADEVVLEVRRTSGPLAPTGSWDGGLR
jgi:hypothetical protein